MKLWFVAAILISVTFPAVLGLKCMTCSSAESWDKCEGKSTTCVASLADQCVKLHYKAGPVETFLKGCGSDVYCDQKTNPSCKAKAFNASYECNINCCTGDDCNAGAATRITGIVLLSCTLASLMMFFKA